MQARDTAYHTGLAPLTAPAGALPPLPLSRKSLVSFSAQRQPFAPPSQCPHSQSNGGPPILFLLVDADMSSFIPFATATSVGQPWEGSGGGRTGSDEPMSVDT